MQVLFAFLLAIPFAKGFPRTTRLERDAFFGALASAMAATVLLMAPSAYHRILFRHHDKEQLIRHANRLAIAGTTALAVARDQFTDYVFGNILASLSAAATVAAISALWFLAPLWIRLKR